MAIDRTSRYAEKWPVIEVGTAPSTSTSPAKGVVALRFGNSFFHLDAAGAAELLADLEAVGVSDSP